MASALKSAFVVGYTGATGKALVIELAKSKRFERVVLIGRRKVEFETPELQEFEQRVIDYEKIKELEDTFSGFDVGFCCLGTTKKAAGSPEAFRHIDFDYVNEIAQKSKEGGTKHFHYVSSAGANKNSYFLYSQVKGQLEEALDNLSFDRLSLYHPRMLERGAEVRGMEKFVSVVCTPIKMIYPQLMFTPCDMLSRAMINNCDIESASKTEILENSAIYRLGKPSLPPQEQSTKGQPEASQPAQDQSAQSQATQE